MNKLFFNISSLTLFMMLATKNINAENSLNFNPNFLENKDIDLSIYEQGKQDPGEYKVNVYLNQEFKESENISFFINENNWGISGKNRGLYPCINEELMQKLGINTVNFKDAESSCLDIESLIEDSDIKYNFLEQKLSITIPQIYVRNSARGEIPESEWENGITAALLNYNFNSNHDVNNDNYFIGLESGINFGAWRLRNNSTYVYNKGDSQKFKSFNSVNTFLERPIPKIKSNLVIGESYSSNPIFDSVGFRGIRLYSAEEMKPNSLQGFAPTVKGIAQTRAKVTIRQNGNLLYQTFVSPGPFVIDDLFPTGSSGNLEVTIAEENGSTKVLSLPFSVLPILQRENNFVYDITAGNFLTNNNNQDKPFFTQGTFSYGVNNLLTVYGGGQLSSNYRAISAGIGGNLGTYGALSFDITHADSTLFDDSKKSGQSLRFLYSKNLDSLGTTFKLLGYRYSTKGFYTLNDVTYNRIDGYEFEKTVDQEGNVIEQPFSYYNLQNTRKGRFSFNINQSLNNYGNLYASIDSQNYWNTKERTQNIAAGYSNSWNGINYNIGYSLNQNYGFSEKERIFSLSINLSLDTLFRKANKSNYLTTNFSNSNQRGNMFYTGINGRALSDNNFSYNIGFSDEKNSNGFINTSFNYDSTYGQFGAGYFYNNKTKQSSFSTNASGGAIIHSNGVTIGSALGGTNVLVQAKGASGLPVIGKTGVKTDFRGYAVVPYLDSYRRNRIALDTKYLKDNVELENNIKFVVPTKGAIVLAKFHSQLGYRILVHLSEDGKTLPLGSIVSNEDHSTEGIVGENGMAYLTGLEKQGTLTVNRGSRVSPKLCTAPYTISDEELSDSVIVLDLDCKSQ